MRAKYDGRSICRLRACTWSQGRVSCRDGARARADERYPFSSSSARISARFCCWNSQALCFNLSSRPQPSHRIVLRADPDSCACRRMSATKTHTEMTCAASWKQMTSQSLPEMRDATRSFITSRPIISSLSLSVGFRSSSFWAEPLRLTRALPDLNKPRTKSGASCMAQQTKWTDKSTTVHN